MSSLSFQDRYEALEARMRARAKSEGGVYLPNVAPSAPVNFVFICMEPSLGRWARTPEEAERRIGSGFRNFLDSPDDMVLAERRSGHVIMFVVGLFAAAMPVMHMRGAHYPQIAAPKGGFFFVWTLWALGALGGVTMILSVRGLWSLRSGGPRK